jgi:CheY-like chemotaxis protein
MITMKIERTVWPGLLSRKNTRKMKIRVIGFGNPDIPAHYTEMNHMYTGGNRGWLDQMRDTRRSSDRPSKVTRVVLADDHDRVRAGIRHLLEKADDIVVVGEASDGLEAIELVEEFSPDVLLLDMEMPVLDGNQVAENLKKADSQVRILAISAYDDRQYILGVLKRGAVGYITKDEVPNTLISAIRGVAHRDKTE